MSRILILLGCSPTTTTTHQLPDPRCTLSVCQAFLSPFPATLNVHQCRKTLNIKIHLHLCKENILSQFKSWSNAGEESLSKKTKTKIKKNKQSCRGYNSSSMFGRPTQLAFLKLHAIIICCLIWIAGEEKKKHFLLFLSSSHQHWTYLRYLRRIQKWLWFY